MVAGFIALYLSSISMLFEGRQPFPLIRTSDAISAHIFIFAGAVLFLYAWSASEEEARQLPTFNVIARLLLLLLLGIGVTLAVMQPDATPVHPIDLLLSKGRDQHHSFASQAKTSSSLREAVAEYQKRYQHFPPP